MLISIKEEWMIMLIDTTIMTANEIADMKLLAVLYNIYFKFTKKSEVVSNSLTKPNIC